MSTEVKAGLEHQPSSPAPDDGLAPHRRGEFPEGDGVRERIEVFLDQADQAEASPLREQEQVTQTPLDEAGRAKIRALFESTDCGYEGFALPMLRKGKIDVDNLPKGSAPFWVSPEDAFAELARNLTMEELGIIEADYRQPAIVIEPITAQADIYVKDENETGCDIRRIGATPFYISSWFASYLDHKDREDRIAEDREGREIIGWRIGIVDRAPATKILATDGDVSTKILGDRATDFRKRGHGRYGFESLTDHPIAYGLLMDQSRQGGEDQVIDDPLRNDGASTMGTQPHEGSYGRSFLTHGEWVQGIKRAQLTECRTYTRYRSARIRLALMFDKE